MLRRWLERKAATARIGASVSEGFIHSAASQESLNSSHRVAVPILNAASTGSR